MLLAITTGKTVQDNVIEAFAQGTGANVITIEKYLKDGQLPSKVQAVAIAGILRGNAKLLAECQARGIDYYYIDHAYFNAGYAKPTWMRITKNGFVQNATVSNDPSRWNKFFQTPLQPYLHKNKKNILILPPSDAVAKVFSAESWLPRIAQKIKQHTSRPLIIRHKPGPILNDNLITLKGRRSYDYPPMDEIWSKVYCVVAFNSNLAVDALIRGIPVITTPHSATWPLSNKVETIENLLEFDRSPLFSSLSWGQYNIDEMRSGYAYKNIIKLKQTV
jgi:hypothetical protein